MAEFVCAHCKALRVVPYDFDLDNGATLECPECEADTVVRLHTPEDIKRLEHLEALDASLTRIAEDIERGRSGPLANICDGCDAEARVKELEATIEGLESDAQDLG